MKTKRILSLLLSFVMILGICNITSLADTTDVSTINAYITISKYGEILNDKDGNIIAAEPIELNHKFSYTLDDVFEAAHDLYYDGGADAGYASNTGEYGLYIAKFWGDESGNFGYQVNGGTESVMGLSHEVENGDYIDVCIYKNIYPDTESYTKFDKVKAEVFLNENVELVLSEAGYDEEWNTVFSPCSDANIIINGEEQEITTDTDGKVTLSFDTAGEYIISAAKEKEVNEQIVPAIAAPVCKVLVKDYPDASVTIPSDTELFVGLKDSKHFVSFTQMQPCAKVENEETTTYYFELDDNKTYNYRVTSDDYITYAGKFKKSADFSLNITPEMLQTEDKTKTTIDRDTSSNSGYNVADIYLNINPQGYLRMGENETYQIVNLRNWEAVDSVTGNYFLEPDYHYKVIDENGESSHNVVTVDENGLITAVGEGTAIVLVSYDAINIDFGTKDFYGAIWPENTGVFVVSVGAEDSNILSGMTINEGKNSNTIKLSGDAVDAEHDTIYFIGESGKYTFTPETEDVTVFIANPQVGEALSYNGFDLVEENSDGSFTVPLKNGRNIVKLTKDGKSEYQVITAKKISVTVNNGEEVHPGDTLSVVFDKLYHPANKLAGVYNMSAIPVYTNVSGYENKLVGGLSAQYNFANSSNAQSISNILKEKNVWGVISYEKEAELAVPEDYLYDTFTLSGGMIYASGWGDPYGNHRGITLTDGKAANLDAAAKLAWFGSLPEIEIPIAAPNGELESISLDSTNVKTDYYVGDSFDTSNLIVTANYADEKTQIATNYTVAPEILAEDTEKVIVSYRGKTAEIAVNVTVPNVTAIEVTTSPAKTSYKVGDVFDPSGMVVTAIYENGIKKVISNYSYAPNRVLEETDTEMTVTYTGEDKISELVSVIIPITVSDSSGGGSSSGTTSNSIRVYFTLYGDKKHGDPDGNSDTHTMSANNLELWLSKTTVSVEKGSYVIDAVTKALSIAGIPYTNTDGNYISSVRGLKEFDNGNLSGWMYTLNGKYPSLSVAEQTLKNGDKIVFHYTDDYTKEKSSVSSSGGSFGGSTSVQVKEEEKSEVKEENKTEEVKNAETENKEQAEFTEGTFTDVKKNDWHYESVKYVYENNLMQGTGKGFEPDSKMTRAMLVTVLYRMEKPTEKNTKCSFEDVNENEWYADSVAWAAENGIVSGINEKEFAPDENVSREQMALIFYRYAKLKEYATENSHELSTFTDKNDISDWALEAFKWANAAGIINGTGEATISPKEAATRGQVAAILMRFCENIIK